MNPLAELPAALVLDYPDDHLHPAPLCCQPWNSSNSERRGGGGLQNIHRASDSIVGIQNAIHLGGDFVMDDGPVVVADNVYPEFLLISLCLMSISDTDSRQYPRS